MTDRDYTESLRRIEMALAPSDVRLLRLVLRHRKPPCEECATCANKAHHPRRKVTSK